MSMGKYIVLFVIGSSFFQLASSQELFKSRDIKTAFENGTRSPDGKPGRNYWQNRARYNITVTALPPDRNIKGSETITYINNSPGALNNLSFKLFLNIHKAGAPRNIGVPEDYLTSGVHIDKFTVNDEQRPF